jgi:hypothetical protein
MSRVYFTTRHEGTVELLGCERAWMGLLCSELAAGVVPDWPERLEPRLTPDAPLRHWFEDGKLQVLRRWIRTYLGAGDDTAQFTDDDGTPLDTFSLVLNTALALGSNPVAVMARLHAQCEIHCYVEGEDRAWLADVIDRGLHDGVMRPGMGWDNVTELLRSIRGDWTDPVVTHYSVTAGFPNAHVADWEPPAGLDPDAAVDAWYDLPDNEQWELALNGLRSRPGRRLRLSPESLRARFEHEKSFFDLFHRT